MNITNKNMKIRKNEIKNYINVESIPIILEII